jgi:dienelactone hydrolase
MGLILEWNPIQAAVGYYGSQIFEHNKRIFGVNVDKEEDKKKDGEEREEEEKEEEKNLQCPIMLHFGGKDPTTPQKEIDLLETRHSKEEMEIHVYPNASHGFNCDMRDNFDQESAALAKDRTLEFLSKHLAE